MVFVFCRISLLTVALAEAVGKEVSHPKRRANKIYQNAACFLYLELNDMQLLTVQVPDHDVPIRTTRSHTAVGRTEGNRVDFGRMRPDQSVILDVVNPAIRIR